MIMPSQAIPAETIEAAIVEVQHKLWADYIDIEYDADFGMFDIRCCACPDWGTDAESKDAAKYAANEHLNETHIRAVRAAAPILAEAGRDRAMAEAEQLAQTCTCPTSPETYDGPQADCAVHGAIRAFAEVSRELERAIAKLAELQAQYQQMRAEILRQVAGMLLEYGDLSATDYARDVFHSLAAHFAAGRVGDYRPDPSVAARLAALASADATGEAATHIHKPAAPAAAEPERLQLCTARDRGHLCSKSAPHKGERHTADFGAGTYTWGYVPTDAEEAAAGADAPAERDIADRWRDNYGLDLDFSAAGPDAASGNEVSS